LSFLTWKQCGYWKNSITLYERALKVTENNDLAHYNLGNALKDQGKMEEALNEYRDTVRIRPSSADAHNNIGIILEVYFKKYDEAIYYYQQALRFDPNNPGTHFNLGIALAKKGNLREAAEHFRQAIYLKPDYEEARRALKLAQDIEREQNR
jgi:tetratricopeptide (TPR) repeat protein